MSAVRGIDLVRHMQYFLAVADERHFGRAAQSLGMSQPPLSQGIQRLERRLGRRLFERAAEVELTADGAALVASARALVRTAGDILRPGPDAPGGLRLGVVAQLPAGHVSALLTALRGRPGDAGPAAITTAGSLDLVRQVTDRRLDAAVVAHPVVPDDLVAGGDVIRLRTWALVSDDHPLAGRRAVRLTALAGSVLAIAPRADNPAAHDLLADTARAAGITIGPAAVTDDRSALFVAAGGRAVALTADPHLAGAGCHRIALIDDPVPLRLRLLWRSDREPAPDRDTVAAVLATLQRTRT